MELPHLSEKEKQAILFLLRNREEGLRNVRHVDLLLHLEVTDKDYQLMKENLLGIDLIGATEPSILITEKTIQAGREILKRRDASQNVDYVARARDWAKRNKTIAAFIVAFGVWMFFATFTNITIEFLKNVGWMER